VTESNDQSYYEIALTNRQAIFFFVFLLVFVLLVFLSGVWVGRSGQKELLEKARLEAAASQLELSGIPEVQVGPAGRAGEEPASPPDLSSLEPPPRSSGPTTLAQDVGASDAPPDSTGGEETASNEPPAVPQREPEPEPEPVRTEPAPPEPEPAAPEPARPTPAAQEPAAPAAAGSFVIQVFSTKDEAQAKKVLNDLKGAGFKAFMSPVKVASSTMHRVRIGPFQQRSQADQTAAKVKEKFKRFETWVTAASN
jgi:cell division septation protein DedD